MRRWLAGRLIRLAHRIYRPRVTEVATLPDLRAMTHRQLIEEAMAVPDASAAGRAVAEFNRRCDALIRDAMPPERRESRGWN